MAMLSVREATKKILNGVKPKVSENVRLGEASGRVLAKNLKAKRTQPPFDASAMDGYALNYKDIVSGRGEVRLKVVGEAAAGHGFNKKIKVGECVRIFTGAPVPAGVNTVVPQEKTKQTDNVVVIKSGGVKKSQYVRKKGGDFERGKVLLKQNQVMNPAAMTLAAAMNYDVIPVRKKPKVCVIASGDELVKPGTKVGRSQIVASNSTGVIAITQNAGAESVDLGIVRDNVTHIQKKIKHAMRMKPDIIVTIGGASVGEHDLIKKALTKIGVSIEFHKLAMRPGKPVMLGKTKNNNVKIIGLPGNPVSSLVCTKIFVVPLIKKMICQDVRVRTRDAVSNVSMPENDEREEYLRAVSTVKGQKRFVTPVRNQDSSIITNYHKADCLIVREAYGSPVNKGEIVRIVEV